MKLEKRLHNKQNIKKKQRMIFWMIPLVLVAVLAAVLFWFVTANKKFSPEGKTYSYLMGNKLEYSEDLQLVHTDASTLIEDGNKVTSDGTPIFYEDQLKLVIPVSMGYLRPLEKKDGLKRVNYFSELSREGDAINILHNGVTTRARDGFLYDGEGNYIFLEKMKITIGEVTYKVEPLTYVKEVYRNCVEMYDITTGEYQYISITDTDAAAVSGNGYSVNLGTGVLTTGETQRILFADIEAMEALEK